MFLYYFLLILSVFLYLISPNKVDQFIIYTEFIFFVITSAKLLRDDIRAKNWFSFNIIFSFAFFLTSYCFPVVILGASSLYDSFVELSTYSFNYINFDYITKATGICTISYCVYCIAYSIGKNKYSIASSNQPEIKLSIPYGKCVKILIYVFVLEIGDIFYCVLSGGGSYDFNSFPFIFDIYPVIFAITLVSGLERVCMPKSPLGFYRSFKMPLLLSGAVVLLFLFFGERGNAITLVLITLAFYTFYYKRISLRFLLLFSAIGVVLLFAIRETRNKDTAMARGGISGFVNASSESISGLSPLLLFSDLIGATQELCYGYETTQIDGLSYPSQIVLLPFYPFPKLPTLMSHLLYGKEPGELVGASILNEKMSSMTESAFGSHIVVDIYMRWGLLGIFIAFYAFGSIVALFYINRYENCQKAVMFLLIMGMSLYISRSSITDLIRPMAYTYFFVSIFSMKPIKKRVVCIE